MNPRGQLLNLASKKFGRLSVIGFSHRKKYKGSTAIYWFCRCDCGNERTVGSGQLLNGKTKSCGCLRRETTGNSFRKHGLHGHRLYAIWKGIRARCNNPKSQAWRHYGGRGIKLCSRWNNFENFAKDLEPSFREGLSLDRFPDKDGDYCPSNVRWATSSQQNTNSNHCRILTFNGKALCISQWSKECGISAASISRRLKDGWPIKDAISLPKNARH